MTFEALIETIKNLILKRNNSTSEDERTRLNTKLTKLYDLKYIMLQQNNK